MTRPLDGLIVVSLEHAVAAPFASRQLADMGARVIKIERPIDGDFARRYDDRVNGMSSHFIWVNRSKESLTLMGDFWPSHFIGYCTHITRSMAESK
jgi:crotonobetainyl-CoA:carnitine CoA-transferase CaiB-like acyl-CoA transferase